MSDAEHNPHFTNGHHEPESANASDKKASSDITLLDALLVLARNRTLILRTAAFFLVCGLVYALLAPPKYTSQAKVVREGQSEGGMAGIGSLSLLRGFGVDLGQSAMGLSPDAYPLIALSKEVRLNVVRDTFEFGDFGRASFVDYVNRPPGFFELIQDFTFKLPWTIKKALSGKPEPVYLESGTIMHITYEEDLAMEYVLELISVNVDEVTGLMTISATTKNPALSTELVQGFITHLQERIRVLRTQKAREDLEFISERFAEAHDSLRQAENELAAFEDRNTNLRSARALTERDRYRRNVSFKEEVYRELQAQYTKAVIDLKRSEPAVTVLEQPVVPIQPSAPKRTLILILALFLGLLAGCYLAFMRSFFNSLLREESDRTKFKEITMTLLPEGLYRRMGVKRKHSTP